METVSTHFEGGDETYHIFYDFFSKHSVTYEDYLDMIHEIDSGGAEKRYSKEEVLELLKTV
jgi:hypothetical protein